MTHRQLEILAAWWAAKGRNRTAARMLGIRPQVVLNQLYLLRREEKMKTTLELALAHMDEIADIDLKEVSR